MDDRLASALTLLESRIDNDRLEAARRIQQIVTAGLHLPAQVETVMRVAFARETVPWVRGAIAEVLALPDGDPFASGIEVPAPRWDERLDGVDADVARQLINMSTQKVLHEVASAIGRARLTAGEELADSYSASETKRHLEYLSDVCAGLRTLSAATALPAPDEFDLAEELEAMTESLASDFLCPARANGPAPFMVLADRTLLKIAVTNVLVNAMEATLAVGASDPSRAITVTWGLSSATRFHITVIDRGSGPPPFLAAIRQAGVSTKDGHPGYGLATSSEAMRSIDGTVVVRRNDRGGASVVLSWTGEL